MAARTQTRQATTEGKNVSEDDTQAATLFLLTLHTHKWLEFGVGSLHLTALDTARIQKPVHQLSNEVERWVIVTYDNIFWRETAETLPNQIICRNSQQDGAHDFI